MVSPFRRQQQKVRGLVSGAIVAASANRTAPPEPATDTAAGQEYAALRVLLHDNIRAITDIKSHEARNPVKKEFALQFRDWIDGVLAAGEQGRAAQDEILTTNMVWAVDYGDIDYALRLGAHAIRHNLTIPGYSRTVACFLAEQIAENALARKDAVTHEQLLALLDLVSDSDMPDPVMARLHKCLGRSFMARAAAFDPAAENAPAGGKRAYLAEAQGHYERAFALDRNVGVKKELERVAREIRDATEALN